MKRSSVIIGLIATALVISLAFVFNFENQLFRSQQSVTLAKHQIEMKDGQIHQLHKKVFLLSKKLKTAANHQVLTYKLKSGDTLYDLFGPSWQKVAKTNNIKSAENLPAGKTINFRGYIHRVKKGENFCKLFGDNWQRIAWLNGFCPQQAAILPAGQCLKVPNI